MSTKLQVLICTCTAEGLARVGKMHMPKVEGVEYLVSCQSDVLPLPESLVRDDVKVYFTPSKGLSNNRNHAFEKATAEYALIADDDLEFDADGLRKIIEAFDADAQLGMATFKCRYPRQKVYPATEYDLSKPYKNYNIASVEIAVRMSQVISRGVRFSPLMGIGAEYLHSGEENVFVLQMLRRGVKGRFFPVFIATHPAETTGSRSQSKPGVLRGNGAYILMRYRLTFLPRFVLKAWRSNGNTLRNLYYIIQGAAYMLCHSRKI